MRSSQIVLCLALLAAIAPRLAVADGCCGPGCTSCKPKWEDKKTKKAKYTQKCAEECGRGTDTWCDHGCCEEDTPPPGVVFTRKKLMKTEIDKVSRVLKYDLAAQPAAPCDLPSCEKCGPCWYDVPGLCRRLFGY